MTIQRGKITAEGDLFGLLIDTPDAEFTFLGDELTVKGDADLGGITYYDNGNFVHSFILPEVSRVPDGYTFKAWSVNGKEKQPGEVVDTAGSDRVSVKPVFEKNTAPQLPRTGDESNIMLWSVLVCISMLGMFSFIRKGKEA